MSEEKDEKLEDFDEEDSNQDSEQIEDGEKPLDPNEVTEEEANKIKGDALEGVTEGIQGGVEDTEMGPQIKSSFLEYAMSVIVARALPDARDGFKPVHRRIIYGMNAMGMQPDKPFKKSARIVGDVMGKYHPHGDSSIYDAMARLAQDFAMRYPLVDGHGNYGSQDGDEPAAMRYTEARMSKLSLEMIREINKNTVDFVDTYDGDGKEPVVLPARLPNLLINGSSGIAVGMATNIPPHNLTEVINGAQALIKNPDLTPFEMMNYIKGPDFPGGGIIMGRSGIRKYFETGSGSVCVRGKYQITEKNGRTSIVFTELPYMVNKALLVQKIAELVKDKKIDGIVDVTDQSNMEGIRVCIDVRRDANPNVILNLLYKHTQLQDTFGVNMLALVDDQPKILNLYEMLNYYLLHQKEVVTRRTKFELNKAEERAHILQGLIIALDNIDEVISIIRNSENVAIAKATLIERFGLSDVQSQAIVDMRLRALTGLEREKIEAEYKDLMVRIEELKEILADEKKLLMVIRNEMTAIADKYGDDRRTVIGIDDSEISMEDIIADESTVITMTNLGYIKRMTPDNFKSQNRGGKGIKGMQTIEDDYIEDILMTTTHHVILMLTNKGRVYKLKAYEIPEASRTARGTAIVNLLQLMPGEKISAIVPVDGIKDDEYLFMATKNGIVKKTSSKEYENIRKTGIQAITLRDNDELIEAKSVDNEKEIFLVTKYGQCIRFKSTDVRPTGRSAMGVIGMNLTPGDEVVGMQLDSQGDTLLIVSEYGLGKRTPIDEFTVQNRGGKGIKCYKVNEKSGNVIGVKAVSDTREIMLITTEGIVIRMEVSGISTLGRITSGVKLINLDEGVKVARVAKVREEDIEEDIESKENGETDNQ